MNTRRRAIRFRPDLALGALEQRALLTTLPPLTGTVAQQVAQAQSEDQTLLAQGLQAQAGITVPAMTMTDKTAEIAAINNLRNQFNAAADAAIAQDTNVISEMQGLIDQLNTEIAALDASDPIELAQAATLLNEQSQVSQDLSQVQNHQAQIQQVKVQVNAALDQIIADIKGVFFVYYGSTYTEYESDGYTATT